MTQREAVSSSMPPRENDVMQAQAIDRRVEIIDGEGNDRETVWDWVGWRKRSGLEAETKRPAHNWLVVMMKNKSPLAMTYSPRRSPSKYHRRWRA
jgi:hypothetical protein